MNDDIKMSRMAGVAAPLLGATQQAVISQMQKFSRIEDKKQEQTDIRTLELERKKDIESRNAYDESITNDSDEPSEVTSPQIEFKKVNDQASDNEILLFAYALSLGNALADAKNISKTDIIRPDDFSGDTLRELVKIFLNIFDGKNETLFARMSDYFSRLSINGQPAEEVMLRAVSTADSSPDVKIKSDMYLALLCKVRTAIINREEDRLMNLRAGADEGGKKKIDEVLRKLSEYKISLQNRIGEL